MDQRYEEAAKRLEQNTGTVDDHEAIFRLGMAVALGSNEPPEFYERPIVATAEERRADHLAELKHRAAVRGARNQMPGLLTGEELALLSPAEKRCLANGDPPPALEEPAPAIAPAPDVELTDDELAELNRTNPPPPAPPAPDPATLVPADRPSP